jgi:hypothetical protein
MGRLAAAVVVLLALSSAMAGAAEPMRAWGIVMERDLRASTLQVDERTYQVSATTVFKDLDGQVITFETLPVFDVHQGLFSLEDATKVEITARPARNGQWVLESVRMIDRLPH